MNVDVKAAKTLLREGVALDITPPLLCFWWKPKVYQPCCMQLVLMGKYLGEVGVSNEQLGNYTIAEATGLMSRHLETFCKILAICLFKNYTISKLLHKVLAKWLMTKSPEKILQVVEILLLFGGTADFITITRFLNSMNLLGQMKKGS